MLRNDYILRLIEQLGVALRAFMTGNAVSGLQDEDRQAMIEESCQQALGLSYSTLRAMPPEHLVELFQAGGGTWLDRCFLVATLFDYEAESAHQSGDRARATECAQRALYLYSVLMADPSVPEDYDIKNRSEKLTKLLGNL